jgi:hypothetical protein
VRRKLKNRSGETITEVMVAVLVVALSAAMLAMMITVSVSINLRAREAFKKLDGETAIAEAQASPNAVEPPQTTPQAKFDFEPAADLSEPTTTYVNVKTYGEEGDLRSYAKPPVVQGAVGE